MAAALRFVHVMGGDEESDAVAGKLKREDPRAGGARRDRCRRWARQGTGAWVRGAWRNEGQALLPSAGKLGGETIEIRLQTVELDDFIHAALEPVGRQAVDAAVELKIFGDGEIVVETEPLRHIADVLTHGSGSVRTSMPSTWAFPLVRGKSPVSILMTVVLPLPLGPRKPKISPFRT